MANTSQKQVTELKEALKEAQSTVNTYQWNYERLEEKLSGLDLQMDNIGWTEVYGYTDDGPSLAQVKDMSKQIRNAMARNVWVKQGWKLRYNYVNSGGIHYDNIPGQDSTGSGRRPQAWARVQDPLNQKTFFNRSAREAREGALYADSMVLYIGDDKTFRLSNFPITQVTADYRNPDDPSEIWAYRRSWTHYDSSGHPVEKAEWIFHNLFKDREVGSIEFAGKVEPVSKNKRVFGYPVNDIPGWAYGVPDAFSGLSWARQYREALLNGKTMSDALATIAYKVINKSRSGAANAGVKVASSTAKGATASMVDGQDMLPMSSAGKGYDYDASRPLLSAMAAGIGVSVVALASDPGAAGSSYGSAQTLDLPTRLMSEARRQYHIDLDKEVLRWLGAPDADVWFDPIEDSTETLRAVQSLLALWNTGLYEPEAMKSQLEAIFGRAGDPNVPEGVLIPNNEESLARRDIDADGQVAPGAGAAPGQGQSTGTGDTPTNQDQRSDTVS